MKQIYFFSLLAVIIFSCKKQVEQAGTLSNLPLGYLANVKVYLKNNISADDYAAMDFSKQTLSKQPGNWYLQIGFAGKKPTQDFILLKTDSLGNCSTGRIIHLEKDSNNPQVFNGKITLQNLNRGLITSSAITKGFIESLHPKMFLTVSVNSEAGSPVQSNVVPVYYDELPEVVVVGYIPSAGGGPSLSDYLSFESLLGTGGSGGGSGSGGSIGTNPVFGIYAPIGGGNGSASSGSGGLTINYETSSSKPGINVAAYIKCFSAIPDAGAQYSISIFSDLPVNDDPSKFFDWFTGATGHVFLQFTKANSSQSITQFMGFTAQKPLQAIGGINLSAGKIVDNAGHKYNASLSVAVSAAEFAAAIARLQVLASSNYDIVNFNCVDFALSVINSARGSYPLVINKNLVPDQTQPMSTPEGLYNLLSSMHRSGAPEAANINIGRVWIAGSSHGPCN